MLHVEDLNVDFQTYDGTANVINNLNLSVREGETTALVGETGCGKTVTAKAILGLLSGPKVNVSGKITFDGDNLLELSEKNRSRVRGTDMGLIMQDPMTSLNPVFKVGEQMVDVLKWRGRGEIGFGEWISSRFSDHSEHRQRAIEMLERVEISAPERVFESYPVELSGGMRQRVLIAIALLTEPKLLIADEPTTALDVTTQSKILDLIKELVDDIGTTVIYITHNLGVAKNVCDSINVMYAGEIVETASTRDLFDNPMHPYTRGLLESIPKLSSAMGEGIEGQVPDYTESLPACRFYARCPHREDVCENKAPYSREAEAEHHVSCHLYRGDPVHADDTFEEVYIGPAPPIGGDQ